MLAGQTHALRPARSTIENPPFPPTHAISMISLFISCPNPPLSSRHKDGCVWWLRDNGGHDVERPPQVMSSRREGLETKKNPKNKTKFESLPRAILLMINLDTNCHDRWFDRWICWQTKVVSLLDHCFFPAKSCTQRSHKSQDMDRPHTNFQLLFLSSPWLSFSPSLLPTGLTRMCTRWWLVVHHSFKPSWSVTQDRSKKYPITLVN